MSIYTPKTLDQAKEIATLISDAPRDCVRLHAAFGAHFGGDMALAQNNAYMLKGKPSLNADAMAGIVRRSGVCSFMVITSWDNTTTAPISVLATMSPRASFTPSPIRCRWRRRRASLATATGNRCPCRCSALAPSLSCSAPSTLTLCQASTAPMSSLTT